MIIIQRHSFVKSLNIFFFAISSIEVVSELYSFNLFIIVTKPLIPLSLMFLYFLNSSKKSILFFLMLFFSLITNLLFIPKSAEALFFGVISYTLLRFFLVLMIFKSVKINNYLTFSISMLPLGFIFFYLLPSTDVPEYSYYLIILNNLIAAIIGGIAISNYIVSDNKQNSFLLISVLLFLGLQLIVYIEKYYFVDVHSIYLRPLAMLLNVFAFYTFYKFIIYSEKLDTN
jgi:hypothetical protein